MCPNQNKSHGESFTPKEIDVQRMPDVKNMLADEASMLDAYENVQLQREKFKKNKGEREKIELDQYEKDKEEWEGKWENRVKRAKPKE
jgi:hypothetical protein